MNEEHYEATLRHMQDRLMQKRQHYEKRLARMRTNLIAVTEDQAILESKMGDAKWAEGRAKQQLDALQAYATQTRTEHYELKTQLKEQLKQSKVMAPPPAPAPAPSVTVKDQLMAEHEKTV